MADTHPGYIERHSGNGLFNYPRRQMVIDLRPEHHAVVAIFDGKHLAVFADA